MMITATVSKAAKEDIAYICKHMREIDVKELWAAYQMSSFEVLENAGDCQIVHINNTPAVLFGCESGIVWMVATEDIKKIGIRFLLGSQDYISGWLDKYKYLYNYVHVDNHISIRWLKWLGFTIYPPEPYGALQEQFHLFEKRCI